MKMIRAELNEIVIKHGLWLKNEASGSRADLSEADLSRANLPRANLSRANLPRANLSGADLSGADLSGANLSGADLSGADLSGADLSGANLSWATLSWANLSWADLWGANLSEADLSGANLSRADLSEASMTAGIKIVSVSGIGSSRRLTNYRVDTDEVWCGCFKGTLAEFADEVKNTHKDNPQRLADYEAAIAFFKAAKKSFAAMNKENGK
jgi:hypothetical protein